MTREEGYPAWTSLARLGRLEQDRMSGSPVRRRGSTLQGRARTCERRIRLDACLGLFGSETRQVFADLADPHDETVFLGTLAGKDSWLCSFSEKEKPDRLSPSGFSLFTSLQQSRCLYLARADSSAALEMLAPLSG